MKEQEWKSAIVRKVLINRETVRTRERERESFNLLEAVENDEKWRNGGSL